MGPATRSSWNCKRFSKANIRHLMCRSGITGLMSLKKSLIPTCGSKQNPILVEQSRTKHINLTSSVPRKHPRLETIFSPRDSAFRWKATPISSHMKKQFLTHVQIFGIFPFLWAQTCHKVMTSVHLPSSFLFLEDDLESRRGVISRL